MQRFTQLLAGASWMAEYGDPDVPEDWAFLKTYSPYHNLSAEGKYPRVLFTTSTKDDRVHPGHARKMAARMRRWGIPCSSTRTPRAATPAPPNARQRAHATALVTTFLLTELAE